MKILRVAMLLLCGLSAQDAAAEHWVNVVSNKTSTISVDTESIKGIGDIISAWYKRDFNKPIHAEKNHQRYRSIKVLSYYNCASREIAYAQLITYSGRNATGTEISHEKTPSLAYGDVTEDETSGPLFNFVCNYRKPHKK